MFSVYVLTQIISVLPKSYASKVKQVLLTSIISVIFILAIIVYLVIFRPLGPTLDEYIVPLFLLTFFLAIAISYSIMYSKSLAKCIAFKRILEKIRVEKDRIIVPSRARISYGVLEAGRYPYGERSEKKILSFDEKGIVGNGEIELKNLVAPYIYLSFKSTTGRIKKTNQFYVLSNALKISEGEDSIYLAILGPMDIALEKNVLSVRKDNDYAEAVIEKKNNKINIKLKYNKDKSRAARLVLATMSKDEFFCITKTIGELKSSGEKEFTVDLTIPGEITILPLPNAKNAFRLLDIDHSWIKPIAEKPYGIGYIAGYENAIIRLVLDIPHARDVIDETRIKCIPN